MCIHNFQYVCHLNFAKTVQTITNIDVIKTILIKSRDQWENLRVAFCNLQFYCYLTLY